MINLFLKLTAFNLLFFISGSTSFRPLKINVERQYQTSSCTMGYLSVNSQIICYTLELPWKDNQNDISRIPKGTYKGIIRYDKPDGWRIQLEGVPNRPGIQIHVGNYTRDITGCVLVGKDADTNGCTVSGSSEAYNKLKNAFYGTPNPTSSPNVDILITFEGVGE
jgi:hypothetical protein